MNRELKFRAWEQNIKIMAYPSERLAMSGNEGYSHLEQSFCIDNRKISLASEGWDVEHEGMLPCILMQFTGLKDKNGKEIYEGDILTNSKYNDTVKYNIVRWNDSRCGWDLYVNGIDSDSHMSYDHFYNDDFESCIIIGNIFEHPELLHTGALAGN